MGRANRQLYFRDFSLNDQSDSIKVPHGQLVAKARVHAKHLSIPRGHFSDEPCLQWNAVHGLRASVCILLGRVSALLGTLKTTISVRRKLQESLIRLY